MGVGDRAAPEARWDQLVAALKADLRASEIDDQGGTWDNARPNAPEQPATPGWHAYAPKDPSPPARRILAPWAGFRLVHVDRVGSLIVVAFTWAETGDDVYVQVVDASDAGAATRMDPALEAELLSVNLLENLGHGWWRRTGRLHRMGPVTFVDFST